MGFKEIGDVNTVTLGGMNKKTGKRNPTELEGYFLRTETREDKKYGKGLQPYYVFLTKDGEVGVHGKTHLNKRMKSAVPGLMTKVVATDETIDTGKGNAMKVFRVAQDSDNSIELTETQVSSASSGFNQGSPSLRDNYDEVSDESDEADFEAEEEVEAAPAPAPSRAAATQSSNKSKIQEMLNKARGASKG